MRSLFLCILWVAGVRTWAGPTGNLTGQFGLEQALKRERVNSNEVNQNLKDATQFFKGFSSLDDPGNFRAVLRFVSTVQEIPKEHVSTETLFRLALSVAKVESSLRKKPSTIRGSLSAQLIRKLDQIFKQVAERVETAEDYAKYLLEIERVERSYLLPFLTSQGKLSFFERFQRPKGDLILLLDEQTQKSSARRASREIQKNEITSKERQKEIREDFADKGNQKLSEVLVAIEPLWSNFPAADRELPPDVRNDLNSKLLDLDNRIQTSLGRAHPSTPSAHPLSTSTASILKKNRISVSLLKRAYEGLCAPLQKFSMRWASSP